MYILQCMIVILQRGELDDHYRDKDREKDKERRRRHKDRHYEKSDLAPPISSSGSVTKVIYYILNDKKETPYAIVVPKK